MAQSPVFLLKIIQNDYFWSLVLLIVIDFVQYLNKPFQEALHKSSQQKKDLLDKLNFTKSLRNVGANSIIISL